MDQKNPYRIDLILIDDFALMSYAATVEPIRAANLLGGVPAYEIRHIPASGEVARASCGAMIAAGGGEGPADLTLVVAGGDPFSFDDDATFRLLRRRAREGGLIGGVSGGPVILARAGLMAGRRMTVHWEHAPALAERMPELLIERSIYVIDRDRVTCAGGAAPMDLMHDLLARREGAAFARQVSDWFMHTEIRRGGDPQRAEASARYDGLDPALAAAIDAMESHLDDPLSLAQLAAVAGVGPRHLSRLFQARMGESAMRFYRRQRLARARGLLASSPLTLAEIGRATGFTSPAHFSRVFTEEFGLRPSALRPNRRGGGAV